MPFFHLLGLCNTYSLFKKLDMEYTVENQFFTGNFCTHLIIIIFRFDSYLVPYKGTHTYLSGLFF